MTGFQIIRDRVPFGAPTTGELLVEGVHFAWTLERPWLGNQHDVSCIPCGTYPVVLAESLRWGRPMPHLLNVPGRDEIEIHVGNFVANTEGCVLLGDSRDADVLMGSKSAVGRFMEWFASVGNEAVVSITEAA